MLACGAVERCPPAALTVSSVLFCVPKRDGGWRPCLDLRPLNRFVRAPSFSLGGLRDVRQLLRAGDYMVSIDLKSAYWHVPLHRSHRRYLGFCLDGVSYRFRVLPFGLSAAPWVFYRLLAPVVSALRAEGVRVACYLDDLVIFGRSPADCRRAGQRVANLLATLGFLLHPEKSSLVPSQRLRFLGFDLDSRSLRVHLPRDKALALARECRRTWNFAVHRERFPSLRDLSCLLGRMSAASGAFAEVRLRSVALERVRAAGVRRGCRWDSPVRLGPEALAELRWWARHATALPGRLLRLPAPDVVLRTDASSLGWGAVVVRAPRFPELRSWSASGRLPPELRSAISNETELFGIGQAVRALARTRDLRGVHLRVQTDSTAALFYVNKGAGRSLALTGLARPLWAALRRSGVILSAEHLPGRDNVAADGLSRRPLTAADLTLRPHAFRYLERIFGPRSVDAFAEPHNAQVRRFACRWPLPGALPYNGLQLDYRRERAYAFPPPALVPILLHLLADQQAEALVVVPYRPYAPWWPFWRAGVRRPVWLTDAVESYWPMARRFSPPLLQAGIFSGWLWRGRPGQV